ncbi:hypothetical protein ACWDZ4_30680 [Streptomyces sp. NPDC003016]
MTLVAEAATPVAAAVLLGSGAALAALLVAALPYPPTTTRPADGPSLVADRESGLAAVWRVAELRAITAATVIAFGGIGGSP